MTSLWTRFIAAMTVLFGTTIALADGVVLIDAGKPASVIVIPEKNEPGSAGAATAAKIFSDHLSQMSGARLEIHTASELDGKLPEGMSVIFVGESELSKKSGFTSEGVDIGGIRVKT